MNCQSDSSLSSFEVVVQSCTSQCSSLLSINGKKPWILDSGATDHLIESYDSFLSYFSNAGNEKIWIANRSFAPIASKSHISPFDGLTLQNVLHVLILQFTTY